MDWGDLPWWLKAWLAGTGSAVFYFGYTLERMERQLNEIRYQLTKLRDRD